MSSLKLSGVGLQPTAKHGEARTNSNPPYLPPSGGGTGLLGPVQRRTLFPAENLKPTSADDNRTLERKYIENLQQQVYLLELELKQLRAACTCAQGQGLDATVKSADRAPPNLDMRDQITSLEQRAERLREDALRAMIGEKHANESNAKLTEQLRRQADEAASQREELTVEAVNLQCELERAFLVEKTLRAELAEANALSASREALANEHDLKVRALNATIEDKERELMQIRSQVERLRKELVDAEAVSGSLRDKLESKRQIEAEMLEHRREASEDAKRALTELRQTQIQLEREQAARKQAEQNEAYLVRENAGLEALVKEVTSTADRLSLENEKIKMTLDQNKLVSVVGRAMVRKFQAKLRALDEMKKTVEEAQANLQLKLVQAQQKTDAIDIEFAKERRRADILAKHYAKQEEDGRRLITENRRLLDKLQSQSADLEDSNSQLEVLKTKYAEAEARAKRLDEEAALATLLKGLRLGDLQSDASRLGDVASAIHSLIPRLEAREARK